MEKRNLHAVRHRTCEQTFISVVPLLLALRHAPLAIHVGASARVHCVRAHGFYGVHSQFKRRIVVSIEYELQHKRHGRVYTAGIMTGTHSSGQAQQA